VFLELKTPGSNYRKNNFGTNLDLILTSAIYFVKRIAVISLSGNNPKV
jgi:hypothetical protein